MTPFIFYLMGGLLAFAGQVDLGSIVAVINAYKDLPGPVKELIDWDQQRQDVQIKYEQVVEQFEPEGMLRRGASGAAQGAGAAAERRHRPQHRRSSPTTTASSCWTA